MPVHGQPCPRAKGARCIHNHCAGDCIELAYEREQSRVDAELHRRWAEGINSPKPGEK